MASMEGIGGEFVELGVMRAQLLFIVGASVANQHIVFEDLF